MNCPNCNAERPESAIRCDCGYNFGTNTIEEDETEGSVTIDQEKWQLLVQQMREKQNLAQGILFGGIAAGIGAIIWAAVTIATGYQIGWLAVGVGFLVGMAVRLFGKGIDPVFGIAGAALSLIGCLGGNLLSVCMMISQQESIPLFQIFSFLDLAIIVELMIDTFSPIDLLFYGIALYEGYKFSFREVTGEELATVLTE